MTETPTPGRHRSRKAPRRRGLIGPVVSALSVLLAIGPVVWVMSARDGSAVADDTKVLNVSEDNSGPAAVEGGSAGLGKPKISVTKTLPNGQTTTITPTGTPALGSAESTSSTSTSATPGAPTTVITTGPTGGIETVTITPTGPVQTANDHGQPTPKPRPSTTRPTKPNEPSKTPTKTVTSEPPPDDPPAPPPGGGGTSATERDVLDLTNQARRSQGCSPLKLDSSLVEAAGSHASDMVRRHYMDHTNPDGEDPGDRMARAGYSGSGWGENIAAGYSSAQKVFNAWMNSDGHRANILNCKFTKIGIGYDPGQVKSEWGPGSWVQDFGRG
ncbi:CAP domain-containing protein [Streptomyces sp. SID13031]|uniref:CAP domain-containing protein n=1 Tax=Streptomyces sp. SID13031 TaxID=2706046 RepID=UPI0013CC8450|nr:CAP domain-containing protein [Streptomyces sp. SID13031]NEA31587.1 CAP domain-containing protein [Streptomyces sp. SID13031]